jgi:hypothetical protein
MQIFLSLGTDCVKIQETADASKGFSLYPSFLLVLFHLFVLLLLMAADIISFATAALTTALARIAALEVELKTSTEALKDANATKVSNEKVAKSAETRAKKAENLWLMLIRSKPSGSKLWLSDLTRFPHLFAVSAPSCP